MHLHGIIRTLGRLMLPALLLLPMACPDELSAQNAAFKTNLLSDALLSPNIGAEIGLAPKWSLEATYQINAWSVSGHNWKHWFLQPEARYWLCQRFAGHFFGLHAIGGQFNLAHLGIGIDFLGSNFKNLLNRRYQGWGAGAGIAYGYAWPVAKHWNVEAEIGVGWIYTRFDSYPCAECGRRIDSNRSHNYFGPTKAAVNIVYLF